MRSEADVGAAAAGGGGGEEDERGVQARRRVGAADEFTTDAPALKHFVHGQVGAISAGDEIGEGAGDARRGGRRSLAPWR